MTASWLDELLGEAVEIPPLRDVRGRFEIPPLAVDLGEKTDMMASVPPVAVSSAPGGLLEAVPPADTVPRVPESAPPRQTQRLAGGRQGNRRKPSDLANTRDSGAPLPPPAKTPKPGTHVKGAAEWQPGTQDVAPSPGQLAAPKPVVRHVETTAAPKPVERHAEPLAAPKPVVRHAEPLAPPKPVKRAEAPPKPAPVHRHRQARPSGQPERVDVLLLNAGDFRSDVVMVVKRLLQCKSKRAKKIVKRAPLRLLQDVPFEDGQRAVKMLRDTGAEAELNWQEETGGSAAVVLHRIGPRKISVLKLVRDLTGLGLAEAKTLVDNPPVHVARDLSLAQAQNIFRQLTEVGAVVEVVG